MYFIINSGNILSFKYERKLNKLLFGISLSSERKSFFDSLRYTLKTPKENRKEIWGLRK